MGTVGLLKPLAQEFCKGQPPKISGCLSFSQAHTINDQPVENGRQKSVRRGKGTKAQWKYKKLKNMP